MLTMMIMGLMRTVVLSKGKAMLGMFSLGWSTFIPHDFLILFLKMYFLCMDIFPAFTSICHLHASCLLKPEEGI